MAHPIHHITAIASNPKQCIDFYSKVLGLRLVKKTVNQDQTEAYHLFFGDRRGEPGMDLTFFTFPGVGQGAPGPGSVSTVSLSVPAASLKFWQKRFDTYRIRHEGITQKFNNSVIQFYDHDNQQLELVGIHKLPPNQNDIWETDEIQKTVAIRSFHSATLSVYSLSMIEPVITSILGFKKTEQRDRIFCYEIPDELRAGMLFIKECPDEYSVVNAAGTVHHIAFQVRDHDELVKKRKEVMLLGLYPTDVIDRFYFQSVYFRTPAGILFEMATNGPGFTQDEDEASLGKNLSLPPFLETKRKEIEQHLDPIE